MSCCGWKKRSADSTCQGNPLDQYREQIRKIATANVSQLSGEDAEQMDGQQVTLVCTVVRTKYLTTNRIR